MRTRRRQLTRGEIRHHRLDLPDVLGRGSAAATGGVEESAVGELAQQPARHVRLLVVTTHGVGQPGVRIAEDVHRRDARHVRDVRPHLRRAERAVDAGGERPSVLDRRPEGLDGLAGQVASGAVDDGDRDEERQLWGDLTGRRDGRLAVERVEDRFDQKEVRSAVPQAARGFCVTVTQLVERDLAERGIVDLRRQRQRDVGRTERSGDEAVVEPVRLRAGDLRTAAVHLVDEALEPVIRLRDRRRGEGVGGDEVGACLEVIAMYLRDDVGPREAQHVNVVAQGTRMILEAFAAEVLFGQALALDEDAHGPVEDDDALPEQLVQPVSNRIRGGQGTLKSTGGYGRFCRSPSR